ncbi:hypothetical protein [Corynebacterium argentoratense]|uniref:hypothetical protein n=1 Tax=Corynebacterium argentoratense TaxID=42817 RepID=UPI001F238996|nr:hypothetical protein [Corynebacterium argentoratense]MCF1766370.1 hypothetical protein [Corynebacterium argentoratense]
MSHLNTSNTADPITLERVIATLEAAGSKIAANPEGTGCAAYYGDVFVMFSLEYENFLRVHAKVTSDTLDLSKMFDYYEWAQRWNSSGRYGALAISQELSSGEPSFSIDCSMCVPYLDGTTGASDAQLDSWLTTGLSYTVFAIDEFRKEFDIMPEEA